MAFWGLPHLVSKSCFQMAFWGLPHLVSKSCFQMAFWGLPHLVSKSCFQMAFWGLPHLVFEGMVCINCRLTRVGVFWGFVFRISYTTNVQ
jgi:hypothetical protein